MAVDVTESIAAVESPIEIKAARLPWIENPCRLVSWWEMEQFSARAFYQLGKLLERVAEEHRGYHPTAEALLLGIKVSDLLSEQRALGLREFASEVSQRCAELGLRVSKGHVDHIHKNAARLTNKQVASEIEHLDRTIRLEMENHLFFFMPPNQADYYDKSELMGADVLAKFPDLRYDIVEAGNCYAASRSTAVVFHLMRIMEVGVQEFGKKLGVTLVQEKNWQNILDEINKAVKALPKGPQAVEMAHAAANLYSVKVAWRNEVMHPNDTYGHDEAKSLIGLVRVFMGQLAGIV